MYEARKAIAVVAERQYGLVTRADLRGVGVSPRGLRTLVAHGALVPVGRQTFVVGGAPVSDRRRVLAACLDTGGVASHATAAWVHGIGDFRPGNPPAVVVRRARSDYRSAIADVHSSTWLPGDDVLSVAGVPTLSVARTLFSLASVVPRIPKERVAGAIDRAVRDRKAADPWLWWLLERIRRRGRNGVTVFEELLSDRAGGKVTESWLEREFLRILAAASVELPVCQRKIRRNGAFVARVDFLYAERRLVVEVSGHASHSTRAQLTDDARRRNELILAGYQFLEFTYDQVVGAPDVVVAHVREALGSSTRRR